MHTLRISTLVLFATGALGACDDDTGSTSTTARDAAADGATQDADTTEDGGLDAALEEDASPDKDAAQAGPGEVTIQFKATVNGAPLACGKTYPGLGLDRMSATPQDFRLYVQEVRLIRADGSEAPVTFDVAPPFQSKDVALLDFTDGEGFCSVGGVVTNTSIKGKVDAGPFVGVVFVNGVPESLNHAGPAETAAAPLDDVTMFWNWLGGYRFSVAELLPVADGDAGVDDAGKPPRYEAAFVHVGSSGCSGTPAAGFTCSRKARNEIKLMGFDPTQNVITADLAAVFARSNLAQPPQCHGVAPECAPPYAALGVDIETGLPSGTQTVFGVE